MQLDTIQQQNDANRKVKSERSSVTCIVMYHSGTVIRIYMEPFKAIHDSSSQMPIC
jgi:hypothetical protein